MQLSPPSTAKEKGVWWFKIPHSTLSSTPEDGMCLSSLSVVEDVGCNWAPGLEYRGGGMTYNLTSILICPLEGGMQLSSPSIVEDKEVQWVKSSHPTLFSTVDIGMWLGSTSIAEEGVQWGTSLHLTLSSTWEGWIQLISPSTLEEELLWLKTSRPTLFSTTDIGMQLSLQLWRVRCE